MAKEKASVLTSQQKMILEAVAEEKYFTDRYYLAGGTAMAGTAYFLFTL